MPTIDRSQDDGFSHIPAQLACLDYTLIGAGGTYTLVLPAIPASVKIESSFAATERWTFGISGAVFGQPKDPTASPRALPKGFLDTLAVSAHWPSIDGQCVGRARTCAQHGDSASC